MDPAELRRRNLFADDAYPATGASGIKFEKLSHHASLDKILKMLDYEALRPNKRSCANAAFIAASALPRSSR